MTTHYLANHDYVDMSVRWDNMSILVITDDRALLRYHVNALGGEANLPVVDDHKMTKERVTNRTKNASKATKRYIQTLVDYRITKGTTATTFSPNMKLTRGQLATFIYNAIQATSDDLTIISVE